MDRISDLKFLYQSLSSNPESIGALTQIRHKLTAYQVLIRSCRYAIVSEELAVFEIQTQPLVRAEKVIDFLSRFLKTDVSKWKREDDFVYVLVEYRTLRRDVTEYRQWIVGVGLVSVLGFALGHPLFVLIWWLVCLLGGLVYQITRWLGPITATTVTAAPISPFRLAEV
jgi:hypothetical protein